MRRMLVFYVIFITRSKVQCYITYADRRIIPKKYGNGMVQRVVVT